MYTKPAMQLEDAKRVAAAARVAAEAEGWNVVIAVTDEGGHLMYLERMDGTQPASAVIAAEKAKTAVLFKRPTAALDEAVSKGGRLAMMVLPGALALEGGHPLTVDGHIVGAVGVSGVQSHQDGVVARAGAAALAAG